MLKTFYIFIIMILCSACYGGEPLQASNIVPNFNICCSYMNYNSVVLLPPKKYIHPLIKPVPIFEVDEQELKRACHNIEDMACMVSYNTYETILVKHSYICVNNFVISVCHSYISQRGDLLKTDQRIFIPKIGTRMPYGGYITKLTQNALLIHEIGHANGWSGQHTPF